MFPKALIPWLFASIAFLSPSPGAAEVGADIRGDARTRLTVYTPLDEDGFNLEVRARPELVLHLSTQASAVVTVSAIRTLGQSEDLLGEGAFFLDRAYFDYRLARWDLRAGRQAINFGRAQIWNPVDLVDANTAFDFAVVKKGADAVRADLAIASTARAIALMAYLEGAPLSLIRGEFLLGGVAVGVTGVDDRFRRQSVAGLDLKGDLGVGYWLEATAHLPRNREKDPFYRGVVGVDYSFPVLERLTLALQAYLDTSGGTGILDYDYVAYVTGQRSFLARKYGSLVSQLNLNELSSIQGSAILNLEDQSVLLSLGATHFFFENLETSARVIGMTGPSDPGEFNPTAGHPLEGSLSPLTFQMDLSWRF